VLFFPVDNAVYALIAAEDYLRHIVHIATVPHISLAPSRVGLCALTQPINLSDQARGHRRVTDSTRDIKRGRTTPG